MSKKEKIIILALAAAAMFLLTASAVAATSEPARLLRPDSYGYLAPAKSLAFEGIYSTTLRPPGYPLLAAAVFFCGGGNIALAWAGVIIAAASCLVTGWAAKTYSGSSRAGIFAALWAGLNLTAIANAPLLLSDTLFFLFCSLQLLFFLRFWKNALWLDLLITILIAASAALIKPVNQLIILPLTILIFCHRQLSIRKKIIFSLAGIMFFLAIITPWMYRNYLAGATFAIDTNTGAMRHQNGAMLLAEVNGTDFETEKSKLLAAESNLQFPDVRSHEQWRINEFRKLVLAHPWRYLRQHFDWRILLPDAPSFLENFGITTANRGTMGVLKKSGILAAVKHYFGADALWLLLLLLPLLLITMLLYICAAGQLLYDVKNIRRHYGEVLMFLTFCEYYLFLPGAITAPRYQLPALPFLCTIGVCFLLKVYQKFLSRN